MASVVVVQVGQCGNQLGEALWDALAASTNDGRSPSPFFCRDGTARCVLVDAEPKVVAAVCQRHPKRFHENSVVCGQCGRGNHWALGYHGVGVPGSRRDASCAKTRAFQVQKDQRHDDTYLLQRALCALHREVGRVEQDQLEAIVVVHSLAGGTGSGFASKLVEKIRLHFTRHDSPEEDAAAEALEEEDGLSGALGERRRAMYVAAISVAPQLQGENALQGINTTLTLRSLQRATDAILLLRNDDVIHPTQHNVVFRPSATFQDANVDLVSLLMPVLQYGLGQRVIGELVEKVCPDPRYKLLTLVPLPQRNYTRYRRCAVLSCEYQCGNSHAHPTDAEAVPYAELHTDASARMLEVTHATVRLGPPPKALGTFFSRVLERGGGGGHGTTAVAATKPLSAVMVLNQVAELNRSVLFPLVRDCALKVQAKAFLADFLNAGVQEGFMVRAYREVAESLLYSGL